MKYTMVVRPGAVHSAQAGVCVVPAKEAAEAWGLLDVASENERLIREMLHFSEPQRRATATRLVSRWYPLPLTWVFDTELKFPL